MNKPHKHAEVIKAWADGAIIQFRYNNVSAWHEIACPTWSYSIEYRVKPEPKPDIVRYARAEYSPNIGTCFIYHEGTANIKLVFDGETRKLKSVELINKE